MKLTLAATITAGLLAVAPSSANSNVTPTQPELDKALMDATDAWLVNLSEPLAVYMSDDLGSCAVGSLLAMTEVHDFHHVMKDEDGNILQDLGTTYEYVIKVNSRCDWRNWSLDKVMQHEVGHVLLGKDYHSKNIKSIMYPLLQPGLKQDILPDDRAGIKLTVAEK